MATLPVCDRTGAAAGEFEIDAAALVTDRGGQAVHEVIVAHRAAQRAGTASTLGKGEVRGSNRKPWRQKGTGRARAGYRQSPLWKGGGVIFGPQPRSYRKRVPAKVAQLAFRRVFSECVANDVFRVVDSLALEEPRTKLMSGFLASLGVSGYILLIVSKADDNVTLASRNIQGLEVVEARNVNTYQLLRYPTVVATRAAMDELVSGRLRSSAGSSVETSAPDVVDAASAAASAPAADDAGEAEAGE